MEDIDKIKDKIQKLLNKAESAKEVGNIEEAEAFSNKVNELLTQYNLSIHQLEGNKTDNLEGIAIDLEVPKTEGTWVVSLYHTIAKFNFCRIIKISGTNSKIFLIGEKYNQEIVVYTCLQLKRMIKALRKQRYKDYMGREKKPTFYRGYSQGAVDGIYTKLKAQQEANEVNLTGVTALVVNNTQALDNKVKELFEGGTRQSKPKKLRGDDGYGKGVQDGKNMQINQGLGTKNTGVNQKLN